LSDLRARLIRRIDGVGAETAEKRIGINSRRVDLVLGARSRQFGREGRAFVIADFAHGRDPMHQPELEDVIGRDVLPFAIAVNMAMQIDKAGQDELARRVDLTVPFGRARLLADRQAGRPDRHDLRDAVVLDDDIDRTEGRCARTVDQYRASNDQPRIGALAVMARRDAVRQRERLSHQRGEARRQRK